LWGFLAGKVWQSALDPELKPLAAALADIANDDGTSIYPSVGYMCWLLGRSERAVQVQLGKLRELGVLIKVRMGGGRVREGWGRATEYRLIESSLPKRPPWKDARKLKGATAAPYQSVKGAVLPNQQRSLQQTTVLPTAPYPSVRTVSKSNRQGELVKIRNGRPFWKRVLEAVQGNGFHPAHFDCWLSPTRLQGSDGPVAVIACPTQEHCDWLEEHGKPVLIEALARCGAEELTEIRFVLP
jgi:hypothetical protein